MKINWALAMGGVFLLLGCQRQVLLRASAVDAGLEQNVFWSCRAGQVECTQGGAVVESEFNQSRTAKLPLPECPGGIAKILLSRVAKGSVEAKVVCMDQRTVPTPETPGGCPGGAEPVPDMENGGLKCPDGGDGA